MRLEQKLRLFDLHRKAHRVAFACYIRKGFVPPELIEIMAATRSPQSFLAKFNPDQPRAPAGSPDGGQWTSEGDGSGDTLTDAITPVYPLETALLLFFGGAPALGRSLAGAVADAVGEGALAEDAGAITQRLADTLAPDGVPIGEAGSSPEIRELPGGADAAEQMFQDLTEGGTLDTPLSYPDSGTGYRMPDGSFIGYRPISDSGLPTIDVKVAPLKDIVKKLKFLNGSE